MGLLLALGQATWDYLNQKTKEELIGNEDGTVITIGPGGNVPFTVQWDEWNINSGVSFCDDSPDPNQTDASAGPRSFDIFARSFSIGLSAGGGELFCESGSNVTGSFIPSLRWNNAAGAEGTAFVRSVGGQSYGNFRKGYRGFEMRNIRYVYGGEVFPYGELTAGPLPESVRPVAGPELFSDPEAVPAPLTLPQPLPLTLPQAPPGGSPAIQPSTPGRPGQAPARVPVRVPTTAPGPGVSPSIRPAEPAPLAVPAVGPAVRPVPPVVPVTPVDVVVVDGEVIGGPGQAPRADMIGIAAELGRIERKTENLMSRPENGGPGELAEEGILGALRDKLQQLLDELLNDVVGGSYQLTRPCPPPGGGEPLPPIVVPYPGGTNPIEALSGKLDGIAGLIQAHKDIGQPTCTTPVTGEEVTVHFESP